MAVSRRPAAFKRGPSENPMCAAVIGAAETGEDHAVKQYREALDADISPEFRPLVARQLASVQAAHDYGRTLKSTS